MGTNAHDVGGARRNALVVLLLRTVLVKTNERAVPTAVAFAEIPPPTRPEREMDEHPHPYPAVALTTELFERQHELVIPCRSEGGVGVTAVKIGRAA